MWIPGYVPYLVLLGSAGGAAAYPTEAGWLLAAAAAASTILLLFNGVSPMHGAFFVGEAKDPENYIND